ncbi:helix-turn-helix transcriptional regulator [Gordonibacter sp. An230]|uniref:helix-turn-helix transcriptional regulator n=1 Tax=Gordonibacter sp. An230 TaxID=1965592 RepID=UPI000B372D88|nr:helix-turn-helix transcriptional regulator [Gordonibacter sp. An230]OUO91252.1 helix-turn-helix transcriptional regulator [Gordonibacter sp. An230]
MDAVGKSQSSHAEAPRFAITPSWARCLIALTFELFGTWLTKSSLYPQYTAVLPVARDASSLVGVATLVVLAVWALRKPSSLDERSITTASFVLYSAGFALVVMGIAQQSAPLLLAGACVRSVGSRWVVVLMGVSLCALSKRSCMLCIASAFVASYLLRVPFADIGVTAGMVTLFVLPFATYAAVRPLALGMLDLTKRAVPPVEASITQPAAYVPFAHGLFVAIFIFRIAYGFALTFGSVDGNPQQTFFGMVPVVILLAMACMPNVPKADVLYQAAALFVVGGFLMVVVLAGRVLDDMTLAHGLLYAGSECFDALMWFVLASIGARNRVNALAVFAWGRAASSAGLLFGATVGHAVNATPDALVAAIGIAAVLFLFVAMNFTVLKPFGFQATIDGVRSTESVTSSLRVVGLRERGASVAARYRLTPRETEILELLAHGRNGPFIQEKLVLSRNTVKTHVANIYAKLGVHSQQELIDLVERADAVGADA